MKKLFLIITLILTTLFTSCTVVYVDKDINEVAQKLNKKDFIKLENITNRIYVDEHTDVLYYKYTDIFAYSLTPIMKADGTCLTYTEWKERNK